jgi:hypothetical protein
MQTDENGISNKHINVLHQKEIRKTQKATSKPSDFGKEIG